MSQHSRLKSPNAARQLSSHLACLDGNAGVLSQLQSAFETARDQFAADVLNIAEWQQAEDALDHAYHACVARSRGADVESLCREAQWRVEMAVHMSMVSCYDDGRVDSAYNKLTVAVSPAFTRFASTKACCAAPNATPCFT